MNEYGIGDVVRGNFSARSGRIETAIVRGVVNGQFHGDVLAYESGFGYGTWGYDREVQAVLRRANEEDERAAAAVKAKVSADTDAYLRNLWPA